MFSPGPQRSCSVPELPHTEPPALPSLHRDVWPWQADSPSPPVGGKMSAAAADCQLTAARAGRVPFRTTSFLHWTPLALLNYSYTLHRRLFNQFNSAVSVLFTHRQLPAAALLLWRITVNEAALVRIGTRPSLLVAEERGSTEPCMNHDH